jgi:hypothetical protein
MRFDLDLFTLFSYLLVNFGEIFAENVETVTELASSGSRLNFDVSSKSLDVVDVFGTVIHLDGEQLLIEKVLVWFLKEIDKELAPSKDHRLHTRVQESSIVNLLLNDLLVSQSLVLVHVWKWRDNSLWERSY